MTRARDGERFGNVMRIQDSFRSIFYLRQLTDAIQSSSALYFDRTESNASELRTVGVTREAHERYSDRTSPGRILPYLISSMILFDSSVHYCTRFDRTYALFAGGVGTRRTATHDGV
jgi:hypothetical protein